MARTSSPRSRATGMLLTLAAPTSISPASRALLISGPVFRTTTLASRPCLAKKPLSTATKTTRPPVLLTAPTLNWGDAASTPRTVDPRTAAKANTRTMGSFFMASPPGNSLRLELQILVRTRVGVAGDKSEARLRHPRSMPVDEGQLPDGGDHGLLVDELLDSVEDRLPFLRVHLARLLPDETFDIRIGSIGEGPARGHESVEPGGGVPEGAARGLDDVLQLFLAVL